MDHVTSHLFGPRSMQQSAELIESKILEQDGSDLIVVMAHNGPKGLGAARHDPCGKDFRPEQGAASADQACPQDTLNLRDLRNLRDLLLVSCMSMTRRLCHQTALSHGTLSSAMPTCCPWPGDYGDGDLHNAIAAATSSGRAPTLVVFGHMHQNLHKAYGTGSRNMVHIDEASGAKVFPATWSPALDGLKPCTSPCDSSSIPALSSWPHISPEEPVSPGA